MNRVRKDVANVYSGNKMRRFDDDRDLLIREFEIEVEDVLKLKPLYESAYHFLVEQGFTHPISGDDKFEDLYWERWTPSGAKEQHIWWRLSKQITPYIRWFITINYQTLNVTPKETTYKGKKISSEKTDLIVRIACWLQYDFDDKLKKSFAWNFRKVFFRKVYNKEIEQAKEDLMRFSIQVERFYKGYLEVLGDEEAPADFWAPRGYKEP